MPVKIGWKRPIMKRQGAYAVGVICGFSTVDPARVGFAAASATHWRLSRKRPFLREPPLPRQDAPHRRPEPVSEINVAQPPVSEGCETVSSMGHLLGYARVSPTDQHPQLQVDALTAAGCYRVFTETASGARADRHILEQLLDQLRPGDTLVVWKLDRLGRSLRHLVDTITGLADRGIGFRSLQEAIDTTTPAASWCSMCSRPWPSSNATSSVNARPPGWPPLGPGVATAAGHRS
jgi:Resolvase, N terminal domain